MDDLVRFFVEGVSVRAVDAGARSATFAAATENGVDTQRGKEYLRMAGADLSRYVKNPIVLDTHDRYSLDAIIGKAIVKVVGRELLATLTFGTTERGNLAWQLVKDRMVNALSIGFVPDPSAILDLQPGQTDGTGDSKIVGPGRVIKKWTLFEISMVPVPVDAAATRRAMQNTGGQPVVVPVPHPARPAAPEQTLAEQIRALAPHGISQHSVDSIVLECDSLAAARKRLLEEHAKLLTPVGTPEPASALSKFEREKLKAPALDDPTLLRSLCSPGT